MEKFQEEFDLKKWYDSEKASADLCGSYDFCASCTKTEDRPCEKAYLLASKKKIKRQVLSFEEKLLKANEETKAKFNTITSNLEDNGFKCHICKAYTSIKYKNKLIGKFTLNRNSLKCHLAIPANMYPDVTHLDYSDKKSYANYPFTIKINTKIAMKNIVLLANKIKTKVI